MPDQIQNQPPAAQNAQPTAGDATPPPKTEAAAPPSDGAPSGNGRNITIPSNAFKRIKEEAASKAKKSALVEFAKAQGYESVEAMQAAMKAYQVGSKRAAAPAQDEEETEADEQSDDDEGADEAQAAPVAEDRPAKGQKPAPKAPKGAARSDQKAWDRYARDRSGWERERSKLLRQASTEAARRRDLQRQLDEKEAEWALREAAVMSGVKDVDYAVRLVTRELEGKTEDELKSFDERKFFEGMRASRPYLFGVIETPANTGTGAGGTPNPRPGTVEREQAKNGAVDVRKMSQQEFQDHVRRRGMNPSL